LFRNLSYIGSAGIALYLMNINPITQWPEEKSKKHWFLLIFIRSMAGNFTYFLLNAGFKFAPISLAFIVF